MLFIVYAPFMINQAFLVNKKIFQPSPPHRQSAPKFASTPVFFSHKGGEMGPHKKSLVEPHRAISQQIKNLVGMSLFPPLGISLEHYPTIFELS